MRKKRWLIIIFLLLIVGITPGFYLFELHDFKDNSSIDERYALESGCMAYFHATEYEQKMLGYTKVTETNPFVYSLGVWGNFEMVKNTQAKLIINNNDEYEINFRDYEFNDHRGPGALHDNSKYYYESPERKKIDIDPKTVDTITIQISFIGIENGIETEYNLERTLVHEVRRFWNHVILMQ